MLLGYGAKVGLGNMRVKAENRMVTHQQIKKVNENKNQTYSPVIKTILQRKGAYESPSISPLTISIRSA